MDDVTRAMSKGGVLVVICKISGKSTPLPPQPKRSHGIGLHNQVSRTQPLEASQASGSAGGGDVPENTRLKPHGQHHHLEELAGLYIDIGEIHDRQGCM